MLWGMKARTHMRILEITARNVKVILPTSSTMRHAQVTMLDILEIKCLWRCRPIFDGFRERQILILDGLGSQTNSETSMRSVYCGLISPGVRLLICNMVILTPDLPAGWGSRRIREENRNERKCLKGIISGWGN